MQLTGTLLTQNPIGLAGGVNLYSYAANNPVAFDDPFGLCEKSERGNATQGNICASDITGWSRERVLSTAHSLAGRTMLATGLVQGALEFGARLFAGRAASTSLSAIRGTREGEQFFHYSYSRHGSSLASGVRPGTFVTTDGALSGAAAKRGLALPHAAAPDAVYVVTPKPGTLVQVNGVARPAFGQPGGLPELQIIEGTGPGTVSAPIPLKP